MKFPFKHDDVYIWETAAGTVTSSEAVTTPKAVRTMATGTAIDAYTLLREWGGGLWDKWTFTCREVPR